jgi:hypothetical protein
MENWESIYDDPEIIPTLTQDKLILNGYDIIKYNILNIQDLKFNMVLLMYLPSMWDNDYDYQRTLFDVNHCYETSPYEYKKIKIQREEDTSQPVMDIQHMEVKNHREM